MNLYAEGQWYHKPIQQILITRLLEQNKLLIDLAMAEK